MLKAALFYVRQGWSVIPLTPGDKRPLLPSWQEFQSRRATEKEVSEWWRKYPNANIGLVTGAVSGFMVLDLDTVLALEFAKDQGIPQTPAVATGKGYHVYLKHPGSLVQNAASLAGVQGLDVRGDGGYVVAPPSVHPSGRRYVWAKGRSPRDVELALPPVWLLDLLTNRISANPGHEELPPRHDPDWVLELLGGVEEGRRNDAATRLAGHWLARGLPEAEVWLLLVDWNRRNRPPLPEKELRSVFRSIVNREARKPRKFKQSPSIIQLTSRVAVPDGWNKSVVVVTNDWNTGRDAYAAGKAVIVAYPDGTLPPKATGVLREAAEIEIKANGEEIKKLEWALYPVLAVKAAADTAMPEMDEGEQLPGEKGSERSSTSASPPPAPKKNTLRLDGYLLIQSETLNGEVIAIAENEAARQKVPRGYVVYTTTEMEELKDLSEEDLRLIHAAKKAFSGIGTQVIPVPQQFLKERRKAAP